MNTTGAVQDICVLAILDRDSDVEMLRDIVQAWGARLCVATTLAELRRQLDREPPDVVISNTNLSDSSDWKHVLREIDSAGGLQPLVIASHLADEALWAEVLNVGGFDVLAQPFDRQEVSRILSSAARERCRHAPPRGRRLRRRERTVSRYAAG
jgi:DNA-binding NtrC family response regulator